MDVEPQIQQPISDDQDLAKVLAGVSQEAEASEAAGSGTTPGAGLPPLPPASPVMPPIPTSEEDLAAEMLPAPTLGAADESLDGIKREALGELRPLVDKLNVSPEEKFDTYLLLIRSTDDKTLIAPAHEVAKSIEDETKRAEALLNIIKEIDYLSNPQQ